MYTYNQLQNIGNLNPVYIKNGNTSNDQVVFYLDNSTLGQQAKVKSM